ncbi:LOW QUALITY PROTEIN: THAP domain-containing protein 1-like [Lepeophtheirus salmonis]|uniref:LOW QUALITY PROTEIN: THAP domain-containing protein 1-like n=1 Tax=Lepeophtheirus salmonis TaxID=72036 RepID=UPI003AF33AD9
MLIIGAYKSRITMSCVAFGCKSKYAAGDSISYHRFPTQDPERCRQWVRNLKRDDFTLKKFSRICSEHFTPESFNRTLDVVRLRENAVPTIFKAFPPRLQEEVARTRRKRKSPTRRSSSLLKKVKPTPGPKIDLSLFEAKENVQLDHPYSLPSAQVIKQKLQWQTNMISELADRSKKYRCQRNKISKKLGNMVDVLKDLRSKRMLSEEALSILDVMSDVPKNLLKRMQLGSGVKGSRSSYSPELRAFALTLSFYSTKAYNYVRKTFDLCLPSLSTIRNWSNNV